jgi:ADP-ribose pyrophosphatase YjhB (NUDIX family)
MKTRTDVRAIITKGDKILLISSPKSRYFHHKLPGGGIEEGENHEKALKREIKEEVGGVIEIIKDIGEFSHIRDKEKIKRVSHCFLTKLKGKLGKPEFTKAEKEAGYSLEWISLDDAIKLFSESPKDADAKWIQKRDYSFLTKTKKGLK